jgi:hypothetical protein
MPPPEENADAARRAEFVKHYTSVRPFLPQPMDKMALDAVKGAQAVLAAAR